MLAGTVVSLLRQPGAGALSTLWAEDGQVFLSEAARYGPLAAFAHSYAGYFHLVPRLLAAPAAVLPAGWAAAVVSGSAALCTALVALLVYVASGEHLSAPLSRLLVSAVVVLVPLGQDDVLNSIANLHWYGLYALFWVLVWTPRGRAGQVLGAVVVLLVAGSDILAVGYLPLAAFRAVRRPAGRDRERYATVLAGLLALGLAVQVAGLLTGSSSRTLAPNPVRALTGYAARAVPDALLGQRFVGTRVDRHALVLAAVAWLLLGCAAAVALLARRTGLVRPAWPLAVAAALHSVALYVLPVVLSGVATPRYAVAPAMLLVTALAAVLQPARSRVPLYLLAALLAVVCVVNLRVHNARADGPRWGGALDRARHACASGARTVDVPVPPSGSTVRLPCGYVRP